MAKLDIRPIKEPPIKRIQQFRGMDVGTVSSQILDSQSPDMLNFTIDERGALTKRTGYEDLFPDWVAPGPITGITEYRKDDGTTELIFMCKGRLHRYTFDGEPSWVSSLSYSDNPVNFFQVGQRLFIQDGQSLNYYDGFSVANIETNAYIPTLTVSTPPSGGGEPYEDFNLIGRGFYTLFSGDGEATKYQLALDNLDSWPVEVVVNGTTVMMESDGKFTVDRTKGTVTFNTAPAKGTNNVRILAGKTVSGFKERIFKCRMNVIFGGGNDTRVFISGNPDEPNMVWRSGLYEPRYWPENGFYKVGQDNEKVQGFVKQYDYLVVEKEWSKWNVGFELVDGKPSFPIRPINDQVGTLAPNSIQLIDNNPVSLSRKGVYRLVASNVRDERNVEHISGNIDALLLNEPNLETAVSVDFDRKYWLAVNGNVYVFDYGIREWYRYDNIPASNFLVIGDRLYFVSGDSIYRFKKKSDSHPYNDNGLPIHAYWYSRVFDFDTPERYKMLKRLFLTYVPDTHTSIRLHLRTNKKSEQFIEEFRADLLDFNYIDFNRFTFAVNDMPEEQTKKVKEKKITHAQFKIENNQNDESLQVLELGIKFSYLNEVK